MTIKPGIRILALDDASFRRGKGRVLVVGIIGRSGNVDGVISFRVKIDGTDSTTMLLKSLGKSRFREQIKLIATNGVTFGGLNIIDIVEVSRRLGLPVVAVTRKKPHIALMEDAIRKSCGRASAARKLSILRRIHDATDEVHFGGFYIQLVGAGAEEIKPISSTIIGLLRLSHMVAGGIARGESSGRI